jgi:hypothetical protein
MKSAIRKAMEKIADRPYIPAPVPYSHVIWTKEEVVEMAAANGKKWSPEQAHQVLLDLKAKMDDAMRNAALDVLEPEFQKW